MTCSNPNCELGCAPLLDAHDPTKVKVSTGVIQLGAGGGGNQHMSWSMGSSGLTGTVTIGGVPYTIKHNDSAAEINATLNMNSTVPTEEPVKAQTVQFGEFQIGSSVLIPKGFVHLGNVAPDDEEIEPLTSPKWEYVPPVYPYQYGGSPPATVYKSWAEMMQEKAEVKAKFNAVKEQLLGEPEGYKDHYKWDVGTTGWAFKDSIVAYADDPPLVDVEMPKKKKSKKKKKKE